MRSAFAYIGVSEAHGVVIEYDEFADGRLEASIRRAEDAVQALASRLGVGSMQ